MASLHRSRRWERFLPVWNRMDLSEFVFEDRADAGVQLAEQLAVKYGASDPLVLGVARGGVEVAYYVARRLRAELHPIVAKKLPYPGNPEYGFGAVAEDGSVYIAEERAQALGRQSIEAIVANQLDEIKRRIERYRNGKPLPPMDGRTVMLVDDGIATGVTLVPLLDLCRKRGASRVIIAAPVSGTRFDKKLQTADNIEVLVQPRNFRAVGQAYRSFGDFSDDELIQLLAASRRIRGMH